MNIVEQINQEMISDRGFPDFRVGDTIRVFVKVTEGNKVRLQPFQGICIAKKDGSNNRAFRVRKISGGIGVERLFAYYSPQIDRIEMVQSGKIRRARLYYLRDRIGKAATKIKIAERRVKK
jgi:large subunit ribosomal protein L19